MVGEDRSGPSPQSLVDNGKRRKSDIFLDDVGRSAEVRGEQKGSPLTARAKELEMVGKLQSSSATWEVREALGADVDGESQGGPPPQGPGGREEDEENAESSPGDTGWPEDLEDKRKELLGSKLAFLGGLEAVSSVTEHGIGMRDDKRRHYPKNPAMKGVIDEQVDEWIRAGAIEPSRSSRSAPFVLARLSKSKMKRASRK
ncbi:uncharacterized protein LOC122757829 isoform X2 [Drosophila mojavensis]|uniref:uncharacterized protein LOC122757829 isoform X2 n=1 Tax=Drosophila mojavensis TaxID=7230 RepID=UPI001CD05AB1|nr:uncharacterized protein LOC122757829 isoform X2 [Drosophila mojavensis]